MRAIRNLFALVLVIAFLAVQVPVPAAYAASGSIAYGQSITGLITVANTSDDYSFSGNPGDLVTIMAKKSIGTGLILNVSLYAVSESGEQPVQWEATNYGTSAVALRRVVLSSLSPGASYIIRVQGALDSSGRQTVGAYTLSLQKDSPPAVLSPVVGPRDLQYSGNSTYCQDTLGLWCFWQHKLCGDGDLHCPGYPTRSWPDDAYAWDVNLDYTYADAYGRNADAGMAVYAVTSGVVEATYGGFSGRYYEAGATENETNSLLIRHTNSDGTKWWSGYLHMERPLLVKPGDTVNDTTLLGYIGQEGAGNAHLHFVAYTGKNEPGMLRSFHIPIGAFSARTDEISEPFLFTGDQFGGHIYGSFDDDRLRFCASQGQKVTVSMTRTGGDVDPYLFLWSPFGAVLHKTNDGAIVPDAQISNFALPKTGVYKIGAATFTPETSGSYKINLKLDEADAGRLEVISPLALSTTSPKIGESVTAKFTVKNIGANPITVEALTAGARYCKNASCDLTWNGAIVDFPTIYNRVLQPKEEYSYVGTRRFQEAGNYFAEPVVKINCQWGGIYGANRVGFTADQYY